MTKSVKYELIKPAIRVIKGGTNKVFSGTGKIIESPNDIPVDVARAYVAKGYIREAVAVAQEKAETQLSGMQGGQNNAGQGENQSGGNVQEPQGNAPQTPNTPNKSGGRNT